MQIKQTNKTYLDSDLFLIATSGFKYVNVLFFIIFILPLSSSVISAAFKCKEKSLKNSKKKQIFDFKNLLF